MSDVNSDPPIAETDPAVVVNSDPPKVDPPKVDPPKVDPPKVEPVKVEVLDPKSKTLKITFWWPQSKKPEISIDGGEFIELPFRDIKKTLDVKLKGDKYLTPFPLTVVFRNERQVYRKQVFDDYGDINPTRVSIQRAIQG